MKIGKADDKKALSRLNNEMTQLFFKLLKLNRRNLIKLPFFTRIIIKQARYARKRNKMEKDGLHVPPFMIFSITQQCNLRCAGCYMISQGRKNLPELSVEKVDDILMQGKDLGISISLIAGGEPLMRKDLIRAFTMHRDIIFGVFTNGMLCDDDCIRLFVKNRHMIPILSFEGHGYHTDGRRGHGVFDNLMDVTAKFGTAGLLFGISLTVTTANFDTITHPDFLRSLANRGCSILFFNEFVPVEPGSEHLCITADQRNILVEMQQDFRRKYRMLFLSFPSGEEKFGGCLAAGRGFIHINAHGNVEPCPFAPFSDSSLKNLSLREALQSDVLRLIRENNDVLEAGQGGCSLWENREKVHEIINSEMNS